MGREGKTGGGVRECFADDASQTSVQELLETYLFPRLNPDDLPPSDSQIKKAEGIWEDHFNMWLYTRDFVLEGRAFTDAKETVREAFKAAKDFQEKFEKLQKTLEKVARAEGVAHARPDPDFHTSFSFSRRTFPSVAHPSGVTCDALEALAPIVSEPVLSGKLPLGFVDCAVNFRAGEPLLDEFPERIKILPGSNENLAPANRRYFKSLEDFHTWFGSRLLPCLERLTKSLPNPRGARQGNGARRWLAEVFRSVFDDGSQSWRGRVSEREYRDKRLEFVENASAQAHHRLLELKKDPRHFALDASCVCTRRELLLKKYGASDWDVPPGVGSRLAPKT
ncbi:MAG: hypothetical protein KJ042_05035 [Deltaproteobacteria bacterium]|nr:hypothetical protein [Deltaproteobacteria bacterium]